MGFTCREIAMALCYQCKRVIPRGKVKLLVVDEGGQLFEENVRRPFCPTCVAKIRRQNLIAVLMRPVLGLVVFFVIGIVVTLVKLYLPDDERSGDDTARKAIAKIKESGGKLTQGDGWVSVRFTDSPVTDADLEHLKGLTDLVSLNLSRTRVTDAGLEYLEGLTNLEVLNLSSTGVTDAGLQHLGRLANLEALNLSRTRVADAGLEYLEGLTNLKNLDVRDTQVSGEGELNLLRALPNCRFRHY